jgi:hypothetical protein
MSESGAYCVLRLEEDLSPEHGEVFGFWSSITLYTFIQKDVLQRRIELLSSLRRWGWDGGGVLSIMQSSSRLDENEK